MYTLYRENAHYLSSILSPINRTNDYPPLFLFLLTEMPTLLSHRSKLSSSLFSSFKSALLPPLFHLRYSFPSNFLSKAIVNHLSNAKFSLLFSFKRAFFYPLICQRLSFPSHTLTKAPSPLLSKVQFFLDSAVRVNTASDPRAYSSGYFARQSDLCDWNRAKVLPGNGV